MEHPYSALCGCNACEIDGHAQDNIADAEEWAVAAADMKAREGAWEDNGCRPLDGYEGFSF